MAAASTKKKRVDWSSLATQAEEARSRAYAPYSNYHVGAALLAAWDDGREQVFLGANVENASYGLCACAERNAVAAAVIAGARTLRAIAIATQGPRAGSPCGMCRQVMAEFAPAMPVALVVKGKIRSRTHVGALLPGAFRGSQLPQNERR